MRIKFYSKNDLSSGWYLNEIIKIIKNNKIEFEWIISDMLDYYNILKYLDVDEFRTYIEQETNSDIDKLKNVINRKIGTYISDNKERFIDLFENVDQLHKDDFFEVLSKYKLYEYINKEDFGVFLTKKNTPMSSILKYKKLVTHFDKALRDRLVSDSKYARLIISCHLREELLFLPRSLTSEDKIKIIDNYIDSGSANINILRSIITFPPDKGLSIPDNTKLKAKRTATEEEKYIIEKGSGFDMQVLVSFSTDQVDTVSIDWDNKTSTIKINKKWIEDNKDYPTLWNNFIYLLGYVDKQNRVGFVSKKNESSVFEYALMPSEDYLYLRNIAFNHKEMVYDTLTHGYIKVLNNYSVRLEHMIEWFFEVYIKEHFKITNFVVKMPSEYASYFEKCRTILPEIDRIFKQYSSLIENGMIDQELIQMSSSSTKFNDIRSMNAKKYVYASSRWINNASHLLFSDQSRIVYIPKIEDNYENFYHLIKSENVEFSDFNDYQQNILQWLLENRLIAKSNSNQIIIHDTNLVNLLYDLYKNEVISYWHLSGEHQNIIERLYSENHVRFGTTLLSEPESDYFDYYLNKSKFTNGYELRNKYLHGTNTNEEAQHKIDYFLILKLLIIIVLKINDDLDINDLYK